MGNQKIPFSNTKLQPGESRQLATSLAEVASTWKAIDREVAREVFQIDMIRHRELNSTERMAEAKTREDAIRDRVSRVVNPAIQDIGDAAIMLFSANDEWFAEKMREWWAERRQQEGDFADNKPAADLERARLRDLYTIDFNTGEIICPYPPRGATGSSASENHHISFDDVLDRDHIHALDDCVDFSDITKIGLNLQRAATLLAQETNLATDTVKLIHDSFVTLCPISERRRDSGAGSFGDGPGRTPRPGRPNPSGDPHHALDLPVSERELAGVGRES